MKTLEKSSNRGKIISPNTKVKLKNHLVGVVDDKRMYLNNWNVNKHVMINKYVEHIQQLDWELIIAWKLFT